MTDVPVMFTKEWLDSHTPEQLAEAAAAKVATVKDSSNWQIRIEALRAAARITSAIAGRNTSGDLQTVALAKRFERYLGSGE